MKRLLLLLALAFVVGLVGVVVDPASAATGRVTTPFSTGFEGATIPIAFNWSGCASSNAAALSTAQAHGGSKSLAFNASYSGDCFFVWEPYGVTPGSPAYGDQSAGTPIWIAGHTYQVGMWVFVPAGQSTYSGRLWAADGGGYTAIKNYSQVAPGSWQYVEWVTTAATGVGQMYFRFYPANGGASFYVDDLTVTDLSQTTTASGGGSTCGGPGQPACRTNITDDDGGFFNGLKDGIGSVLSSPLGAIKDAVTSMGSFIVDGFASLLMPSEATTGGLSSMWNTAQTKFPFSVLTELVSLPATTLDAVRGGIAGGPPSDCSEYLCGADGAVNQVGHYAPLSALRGMVAFVLLAGFAYGVLRSVGEAVK